MKVLALAVGISVLLVVGVADGATARPAPVEGLAYTGVTMQDLPISFVLTKDRKKIKRLDIEWVALPAECTSRLPYVSRTTFGSGASKPLALSSRKRFAHTFSDSLTLPGVIALDERPVVRGTVGRRRAFGTFRATAVVRDAAGVEVNRCDIGTISWTAIQ